MRRLTMEWPMTCIILINLQLLLLLGLAPWILDSLGLVVIYIDLKYLLWSTREGLYPALTVSLDRNNTNLSPYIIPVTSLN
jgi:hypothetical protein